MVTYKTIAQRVIDAINGVEDINSGKEFENGVYYSLKIDNDTISCYHRRHSGCDGENTITAKLNGKPELVADEKNHRWSLNFPEAEVYTWLNGCKSNSIGFSLHFQSLGWTLQEITEVAFFSVDYSDPDFKKVISLSMSFDTLESLETKLNDYNSINFR